MAKRSPFSCYNPSFAFLETYARICTCPELFKLGIGKWVKTLEAMIQNQFWIGVNTLLELLTYRLQHIPPTQVLLVFCACNSLHSDDSKNIPWTLYDTLESTILYILTNYTLDDWEFYQEIIKFTPLYHSQWEKALKNGDKKTEYEFDNKLAQKLLKTRNKRNNAGNDLKITLETHI